MRGLLTLNFKRIFRKFKGDNVVVNKRTALLGCFTCFIVALSVSRGWSDEFKVSARKAEVRSAPIHSSTVKGFISGGSKVTGEQVGEWVKTKFAQGDGYIFFRNLKKMETASALLQDKPATTQDSASLTQSPVGDPAQKQNDQSVALTAQSPKAVSPAAPLQEDLTRSGSGNSGTVEDMNAAAAEISRLEQERISLGKRLAAVLAENKKLIEEIKHLKAGIDAQGFDQYIAVADNGDQVYLKGVGEVLLATAFGKTVVKVPVKKIGRAHV